MHKLILVIHGYDQCMSTVNLRLQDSTVKTKGLCLQLQELWDQVRSPEISQLWLTSHPRSTLVLLDTGTPGTSREIYSEDTDHS